MWLSRCNNPFKLSLNNTDMIVMTNIDNFSNEALKAKQQPTLYTLKLTLEVNHHQANSLYLSTNTILRPSEYSTIFPYFFLLLVFLDSFNVASSLCWLMDMHFFVCKPTIVSIIFKSINGQKGGKRKTFWAAKEPMGWSSCFLATNALARLSSYICHLTQ